MRRPAAAGHRIRRFRYGLRSDFRQCDADLPLILAAVLAGGMFIGQQLPRYEQNVHFLPNSYKTGQAAGAHADAYLWIKHPGESDGPCDRGDPRSGLFMAPYAIDLARNAR